MIYLNYSKLYPNAKLNIYLEVLDKRTDGYHILESVMVPISLYDEVFIKLYDKGIIKVETEGASIKQEDNIVYKLLNYFKNYFSLNFGADILINKKIPIEAGLGGGSSDAAFILKYVNDYLGILKLEELLKFSLNFGADIPFFLINKPAFIRGIGEIVEEISLPKLNFELFTPNVSMSTSFLFKNRYNYLKKDDYFGESIYEKNISIWEKIVNNKLQYFNRLEKDFLNITKLKKKKGFHLTGSGSSFYKESKSKNSYSIIT